MNRNERPNVQAADRCVRVVRGVCPVSRDDRAEFLDEIRQLRWANRSVFDEGERLAHARHAVQERFTRLAELPRLQPLRSSGVGRHGATSGCVDVHRRTKRIESRRQCRGALGEVLDVQHCAKRTRRGLRHQVDVLAILRVAQRDIDDDIVDKLDCCGFRRKNRREIRERFAHARKTENRETALFRSRHERKFSAQRDCKRALATTHDVREIHAIKSARGRSLELFEKDVESVTVDVTENLREARTNLMRNRADDRGEALSDRALRGVAIATSLFQPMHRSVGERDVKRDQILNGAPIQNGVRAR